jgi:hypothetical protein
MAHSMLPNRGFCRAGFARGHVVLALAVLASLTAGGIVWFRIGQARTVADATNARYALHTIVGTAQRFTDWNKELPPAIGTFAGRHGSLHFHLRPYMVGMFPAFPELYEGLDKDFTKFRIPGDPSWPDAKIYGGKFGMTNVAANWLAFHGGPQKNGKTTLADSFPDGTENTILLAIRLQMCNGTPTLWGYDKFEAKAPLIGYFNKDRFQIGPSQSECNPTVANTWFSTMTVAMADGSVKNVSADVSARVWALALHPADGEPLPDEWNQN